MIDLDALKARLSEYDDTLPRCQGKVARRSNFAPDHLTSKDEAYHDYDFTTHSPCIRPEGHEGECRNSRFILGWPGYDTLRALIEEVESLRAHRESCHANLLKGYETGKVEERKLIAAWLWQQSVATHDYEGNAQTVSEVYASAARAVLAALAAPERSCFTCRWANGDSCDRPHLSEEMDAAIDAYAVASGCHRNGGGMPADRSVVCPGHEPKGGTP